MLTAEGRQCFRRMSDVYRSQVAELFGPMDDERQGDLFALLGDLKQAAMKHQDQSLNGA